MRNARCARASSVSRARLRQERRFGLFFRELVDKSVADPDRRGCLIVNSALEVSPHDSEMRKTIAAYLGEIESFFRRCIERGQASGDINSNLLPRDAARLCLGIVLGLRVAARSRPERTLLEGMVSPRARPSRKNLDQQQR